jgi:hypothetical protein
MKKHKFKFYIKNDPKQEAIGIIHAKNIIEAEFLASEVKRLPHREFIKIYSVNFA